jgi:hypothetical protein
VNLSGLEYAEPGAGAAGVRGAAGIDRATITEIVDGWGANLIRLPFNQARALSGGSGFTASDYLAELDAVVRSITGAGAYALLDLHWRDTALTFGCNPDGSPNRVPPLPDAGTVELWKLVARRYRDAPGVLFDLFNEPHDRLRVPGRPEHDDPHPLIGIQPDGSTSELETDRVTMQEWQAWVRALVTAVRREHADAVIFVSGIAWGYDLSGMPVEDPACPGSPMPGLVYSTHVYPWCGSRRFGRRRRPGTWRREWHQAFGHLAGRVPLFVGEWGGGDDDERWGRALVDYMSELGLGWAAWSWHDRPRLTWVDSRGARRPTRFGNVVKAALTGHSGRAASRA